MTHLCTFFNTAVENTGTLAWLGNKALTPFRYLFDGRTIRIKVKDKSQEIVAIHRVASFFSKGGEYNSRTDRTLVSTPKGMIKTAIAIVLLIPGLIIGSGFKAFSYLFSNVRRNHLLVKENLTPCVRTIGGENERIKSEEELFDALAKELHSERKNRPTSALIIYSDTFQFSPEKLIRDFNPMKLILDGPYFFAANEPEMTESGKWEINTVALGHTQMILYENYSVKQALNVTAPKRSFWKSYHMVFSIPKQP